MIKNSLKKDCLARLILGVVIICAGLLLPVGMIMKLALIVIGVGIAISSAFPFRNPKPPVSNPGDDVPL